MFESWRAHGLLKPIVAGQRHLRIAVEPRALPPAASQRTSRAAREREARLYRDLLTPAPEAWALRKMGFCQGCPWDESSAAEAKVG
jgi:hypothetical protein